MQDWRAVDLKGDKIFVTIAAICRAAAVCFSLSLISSTLWGFSPTQANAGLTMLTNTSKALNGGTAFTDADLTATGSYAAGSDSETATVDLKAKGPFESLMTLTLGSGQISELRQNPAGSWAGVDHNVQQMAGHNCLTPAAWFLPHGWVSQATQDTSFAVTLIGEEQHNGQDVQHLQITWAPSGDAASSDTSRALSTADLYIDPTTYLPTAVHFSQHPDANALLDIPIEIQFSDYRQVGTAQVPYHIVKLIQNTVFLDFTVSAVSINTGLPDSDFVIQ